MTDLKFYLLLGGIIVIIISQIAILYEVFIDTEMKILKRNVKIKALQAKDQELSLRLQSTYDQYMNAAQVQEKDDESKPSAIGYGVQRD